MNSTIILAPQETHDQSRQQIMKDRAIRTANILKKQAGIVGILLSGSVVRGPVSESSDLDLHVIVSNKFSGVLPEWTFHKEGIIENLHTIREDELFNGWCVRKNENLLAFWFYRTKFGDQLNCFVPLWWSSNTKWQERLLVLLAFRQNLNIEKKIAQYYIKSARLSLDQAQKACISGAYYDSHHNLRMAFQSTLTAAMINRNWIIRGSKKRIEIAQAFLPDSKIKFLLDAGLDIIDLKNITFNQAKNLCKKRLRYRRTFIDELYRLKEQHKSNETVNNKLKLVIKNQEKHDSMAYDYYESLLANNIIFGPINHIRCFSGLSQIPQTIISCFYHKNSRWPMNKFINSSLFSKSVRNDWLEIMSLTSSNKRCVQLSLRLIKSIDSCWLTNNI